jgi:chitodextrinase
MKRLFIFALILSAFAVGVSSCKAWRTVSTSATYVQQNDTSKTTTTISTKTVEEYTGVKKN